MKFKESSAVGLVAAARMVSSSFKWNAIGGQWVSLVVNKAAALSVKRVADGPILRVLE